MKRTISIFLVILMLLSAAPLAGVANTGWGEIFAPKAEALDASGQCGENVYYTFDASTGMLTISGSGAMYDYSSKDIPWQSYRSSVKTVEIESGVTNICSYEFYYCDSLTSITLPNSITSIGYIAFAFCTSLASITIPDSVTSIGVSAFFKCESLTSITIPDSVISIGNQAFHYCSNLKSISVSSGNPNYLSDTDGVLYNKNKTELVCFPAGNDITDFLIPDGITIIGKGAFAYCTSLTSITFPDSLTSIEDRAFLYCASLTSVTIPDSVTSIGDQAFSNCTSLISITIPDSVTSIGDSAFVGCSSLTNITVPSCITSIRTAFPSSYYKLTTAIIDEGVTGVPDSLFSGCSSLTSVTIPDSVTSIGVSAFYGCTNLTSVTIPGSVTSVGDYAFYQCTSLTSITIPDSVTKIGTSTFFYCTSLTSITILDSVTSIGDNAFAYCASLISITIPDSVTSIGGSVFYNCVSLTSITIPDSVISIGNQAFSYCTSLTSINVSSGNLNYLSDTDGVLYNKNKTELICFPAGNKRTDFLIPDGIMIIRKGAFINCKSLTSITIPDSVTSIEDSTFYNCTSLTSITIPDSVTSIGGSVFYNCASLTSITIPDSVISIGDLAFLYCYSLRSINVSSGNSNYLSDTDGVLYNKNKTELICFPAGNKRTDFLIPDGIMIIRKGAFLKCTSLTSITIPDSVTSIGYGAFEYCRGLTSITIPDSVTSIGNFAFYDCTNLTSITIQKSVTNIGKNVFSGCSAFNDVYYFGKQEEWDAIDINSDNAVLTKATVHYMNDGEVTTAASCVSDGIRTYTCTVCPATLTETIPALGHDYVDHDAKAPNCTEIGWDAYQTCSRCDFTTYAEKAALDHDYVDHDAKDPTCTETGWDAYQTCSRCDHTTYVEKAAKGHSPAAAVMEKVVSATCSKSGSYDEVVYCSVCGVELSRTSKTIAKKSHTYNNIVTPATLTKDGKVTPTCSVCGAKKIATAIAKASGITISKAKFVYNGKVQKPTLTVKDSAGKTIASKYYTATWSNSSSKTAGTYTVKVTLKGNYSGTQKLTYTIAPRQVTGLKAATVKKDSIKVTWTKLSEAKAYKVEYSTDGKTWTSKIVTTNSFTLSKLKTGAKWQFRVTALSAAKKGVAGKVSAVLKTGTLTAAPTISKLTSTKSKTATVTWGKVTGAKSYTVYTSTDGKTFKAVKTGVTKTTYTITGLKAGKKVYVKVQAVNAYGAKSAQSAAKSVTVKK